MAQLPAPDPTVWAADLAGAWDDLDDEATAPFAPGERGLGNGSGTEDIR